MSLVGVWIYKKKNTHAWLVTRQHQIRVALRLIALPFPLPHLVLLLLWAWIAIVPFTRDDKKILV